MTSPPLETTTGRTSWLQRLAGGVLRAFGWQCVLVPPPGPKGLIVVYPHTSNWDFIIGVLYKFAVGLPAHWMGKDTLFRWPLRRLFLGIGGVPINRRERSGFVATLLREFDSRDWMWLAVAPEGTRSHTDHWKSGFYRIAVAGRMPVGLGYIDYSRRRVGIDTYLDMTGDPDHDMARIGAFYADKQGRRPRDAGDIRLRP